jgi:hypothetical protein
MIDHFKVKMQRIKRFRALKQMDADAATGNYHPAEPGA